MTPKGDEPTRPTYRTAEPEPPLPGVPMNRWPSRVLVGASNVKDAEAVIARNRWRFKACYNKCLAVDPTCGGLVKVTVKLGSDGEVVAATTAATSAPAALSTRITSAFSSLKFAPPEGGSATFTTPVALSSKK